MALTPEQQILGVSPEVSDLSRQKKIAELLMSQGLDQPQGQMISGYYVAPSWSQQLNPLFKAIVGTESAKSADRKELELAAALRGQKGEALTKFQQLMANPQTRGQAMQFAANNQFLQPIAAKLAEGIKLSEGERYVIPGMDGQSIEVASGGQKYRAPLHFDVGNAIELRDPNDPTKVLQRIPKGISPESAARLADEGIGGYGGGGAPRPAIPTIAPGSPILARPGASLAPNAPAYAQGAMTMPAAGGQPTANPYEDFNKSLTPPAGLPPKDQRKWMAEANSPLTGEAAKQVTGAINAIAAIDDYRNLVAEAARTGIVSPEQRAKLESARNTMNLLGKEAYNLGVLNGPDLSLMNSLTVDFNNPKSLLLSKESLDRLIEKQRNVMGSTIQNVYGTQQKKIPAYVIDKLKPAKMAAPTTQTGNIERPSMIDENTWNFMTPQEKALFRKQ